MRCAARATKLAGMRYALAALALVACSDSGSTTPDATVEGDTTPTDTSVAETSDTSDTAGDVADVVEVVLPTGTLPDLTITWAPCNELNGEAQDGVDCADVTVPVDWEDPARGTITVFVKRVRSALQDAAEPGTPRRALWFLMGGPGQAGADAEPTVAQLMQRDPGLDFYLPDHRGTGRSTRLSCPLQEGTFSHGGPQIIEREWPACRDALITEHGDKLGLFSTTMAAHDAAGLIGAAHSDADLVTVLGISYGTYLGNRYLRVADRHPRGVADGVVLDSYCIPGACHLSAEDLWEDDVAEQILAHCPDDAACAARFPGEGAAWDALGELYAKIDAGHCPISPEVEGDKELLKTTLGSLHFSFIGRRIVPAVIHRYLRCSELDQRVIRYLYEVHYGYDPGASSALPFPRAPFGGGNYVGYSWPLAVNVLVSELWEPSDPSADELAARWDGLRSCRGVSRQAGWQVPGWPRYTDPYVQSDTFVATDVPLLVLQADLDPATPAEYARLVEPSLTQPHQRYIEIPGAAHFVVGQGQLAGDSTTTCGREILLQFVKDPTATLDTSCLADTIPLGFFLKDTTVQVFFGTTDLWGDAPVD